MKDLKQQSKKLQIFYSFVSNFDTLLETMREMASSGDANDFMRAEGICDIVGEFSYNIEDIEMILERINSQPFDERLNPLYKDLEKRLIEQQDSIVMQIMARNQMLLDVLLSRGADNGPKAESVIEASEESVLKVAETIKIKRGIPIEGHDLTVLNDIASANTSDNTLLSDFSKKFRTPRIRDVITRLYHVSPYYFEQAFSNTSVNIQFILLEIISEDQQKDVRNEDKKNALDALEDLHILATIDTTANKMNSKVSDHQAFELFLNTLSKNNNDYILNKLMNDDIIMETLFNISARSMEKYYGFRRMFITAKFPYDGIVIEKFKRLMGLSEPMFIAIVNDLKRDNTFKKSYENYLKTEKTSTFLLVLKDCRNYLFEEALTEEMVQGICYALGEFQLDSAYNHDLLTFDLMTDILEDIYYFLIRKKAYDKYPLINEGLGSFYRYRVDKVLNGRRVKVEEFGGKSTYGITEVDMWYDCHKMIHQYQFTNVEKMYLRYGQTEVYEFEIGKRLRLSDRKMKNTKNLNAGEYSLICTNTENKGFEHYAFNIFNRIVKQVISPQIHTKLLSIKSSAFRKTEIPGLTVKDDQRFRRGITDYMTLLYMWEKDSELFLHVYKTKIGGLLNAISSIEMGYNSMMQFASIDSNHWILEIFSRKGLLNRMINEYDRIDRRAKDEHLIVHGNSFFELAERKLETIE